MHVILDIDATLADVGSASQEWVGDTLPNGDIPWFLNPDVLALMRPIEPVWLAVEGLLNKISPPLIVSTGRRDDHESVTRDWLVRTAAQFGMSDEMEAAALFMRKTGDFRPSVAIKEEHLVKMRERGFTPKVAFEDRADDAAMYRRHGIFVFQTAEGVLERRKAKPATPLAEREPLPPMTVCGPLA